MRAQYALKVPLGGRTVYSQQPMAEDWGREISGRPELTSSNGHPGQKCHNGAFFRWRRLLSFPASRTVRRSDSSTKRPRFCPTPQECGKTERTGRVEGFWGLDASAIHNFRRSLSASGGALVTPARRVSKNKFSGKSTLKSSRTSWLFGKSKSCTKAFSFPAASQMPILILISWNFDFPQPHKTSPKPQQA